ncbi:MAG: response regulator [Proteobacteria bacterium]|nr:MAG: response regulator [Pseudomonadota bacterium]
MFPASTKILIVDDIQSLRDLLKAYLHRIGFWNLTEATDGQEALDLLWEADQKGEAVGLIISDWNMPNMDGIELLKRIRMVPDWKNLPFLLLTTESEKAKVVEAVQAQVSNYVVKPVDEQTLKEKLMKVWEKTHRS